MIDARPALTRFGISLTCVTQAVQQVRDYIEEVSESQRIVRANDLIDKVLGVQLTQASSGQQLTTVVTIAQAVIESILKAGGMVEDAEQLIESAKNRASKFLTNPAHKWMFTPPATTEVSTSSVAVSSDVDVKVEVKSNGKIKKGGKEVMAVALYEKHVQTSATPLTNQEFIAVLIKELGMTKSGATTYRYNMAKRFKQLTT